VPENNRIRRAKWRKNSIEKKDFRRKVAEIKEKYGNFKFTNFNRFYTICCVGVSYRFFSAQKRRENLTQTSYRLVYILDSRFRAVWFVFVFYSRERNF
jgi:hypothetical protein